MGHQRRHQPRRIAFVVCGIAALAFVALLGRRDIVTSHEARVAETARTMATSGWPWHAAAVEVPRTRLATDRYDPHATTVYVVSDIDSPTNVYRLGEKLDALALRRIQLDRALESQRWELYELKFIGVSLH